MRMQDNTLALRRISSPDPGTVLERAAEWMNAWLRQRYEVFAKRDAGYLRRLIKEMESENGILEEIRENGKTAGFLGTWGLERPKQRLLFSKPSLVRERDAGKPAVMGRIVSLPDFMKAIRLKEEAPVKRVTFYIKVEDELLEENQGAFFWTVDRHSSALEQVSAGEQAEGKGEISGVINIHIRRLTAWLFGYGMPEDLPAAADFIRPIQGVFLDEVV